MSSPLWPVRPGITKIEHNCTASVKLKEKTQSVVIPFLFLTIEMKKIFIIELKIPPITQLPFIRKSVSWTPKNEATCVAVD